jgi:hypothetical protein
MENNTLTFISPGVAKVSWKVKLGEKELETVDSLVLNINDTKMDLSHRYSDGYTTLNVDKDATFYMDADSGDYASRSSKLHVNIIGGGVYYGALNIETSDIEEFGWSIVKSELESYIDTLIDETIVKELIDETPIEQNDTLIANPGKLIRVSPEESHNPFNKMYKFICSDENILESRPVLIYPAEYGKLDNIKDSAGFEMFNELTSSNENENGFMLEKVAIGNVEHFVYIQKKPNSSDAETGALIYYFNKNKD